MASARNTEERLRSALADRYEIRGEIGRGGMATVFLAEDLKHRRQVAVKVLDPELALTLGGQRFLREIEVASTLNHPHILPLYDSGESDGMVFFVMPYVGGGSLRSRLEREIQLPLEDAIRITRQIGDALAYAHHRGVIHRDIKPGNILLEGGHAILADFGVAHAYAEAEDHRITKTGTFLGTPAYMSPEQVAGERDVDGRSDQYSLACVLYEMLTGMPPFRGPLEESVARQHMTADPVPVTQFRPTVPPRVTVAVAQALAKAPADRFRTMEEFGRAVGRSAEREWGEVPPRLIVRRGGIPGSIRALSKRVGLRGRAAALGGVIVTVLLVSTFWGGREPTALSALAERSFQDSVAVLPFRAQGGDADLEELASRVSYEIVRRLSRSGVVKASHPFSVERLLTLGLTAGQIADSLSVSRLISGTLSPSGDGPGDKLTLTIDVSDVRASTLEDTRGYEVDPSLQQRGAVGVAEVFVRDFLARYPDPDFLGGEGPSLQGPGYEEYLVGVNSLGRRTPVELTRARRAFEAAIQQDPQNAYAFGGLSKYYGLADAYRYRTDVEGYQTAALAYAYARRAIELEPNLSDGYSARSLMARRSFAPVDEVAQDCQRAMELEPGGIDGMSWCAPTVGEQGTADLGFRAAEQAIRMDPQNAGRRVSLSYIALALGDFPRAGREARLAWQLEPELELPRELEGWALLLGGDADICASREFGPHAVVRATCLHEMGRPEEAAAIVDSVKAALGSGALHDDTFTEVLRIGDLAVHHAWLGDAAESLRWLKRAYDLSPSGVESRVYASALFDKVRGAPGFEEEVLRIHSGIWTRVEAAGNSAYREHFGSRRAP